MNSFLHHHQFLFFNLVLLIRAAMIAVFVWLAYEMASHMSADAANFWKGVLSDSGVPSWSRVASSLLLIACITWDTIFLFRTGTLPDSGSLTAQALFMSSPYVINTTGKAAMMIATRGAPAPAPAPSNGGTK